MATLAKEDFAKMLITYLTERGGTKRLTDLAEALVRDTIENVAIAGLCAALIPPIREIVASVDISPLIDEGREAWERSVDPEKWLQSLLPSLRRIAADPAVQDLLLTHLVAVREVYESQSLGRSALFTLLGLSDEKLLSLCNEKIADGLSQLERGEGVFGAAVQGWLYRRLTFSRENQDWCRRLEDWKTQELSRINLTGEVQRYWSAYREEKRADWLIKTRTMIEGYVERFTHEDAWQRRVNQLLLQFFSDMVDRYHDEIPRLIEAHVGRLSDDDLEIGRAHV